jgi:hypothetical protein
MYSDGSWIKNLVLFFDGIALLVPSYMKERPQESDPAIVAGLKQHDSVVEQLINLVPI